MSRIKEVEFQILQKFRNWQRIKKLSKFFYRTYSDKFKIRYLLIQKTMPLFFLVRYSYEIFRNCSEHPTQCSLKISRLSDKSKCPLLRTNGKKIPQTLDAIFS